MSNIANTLRAVLELIASLQVRKAECEALYHQAVEARDKYNQNKPAINEAIATHAKAMYAALEQNDVDTAEREGVKYMKWTLEEKKWAKVRGTFDQQILEAAEKYEEIVEEINKAQRELTSIATHGGYRKNHYTPEKLSSHIQFNDC